MGESVANASSRFSPVPRRITSNGISNGHVQRKLWKPKNMKKNKRNKPGVFGGGSTHQKTQLQGSRECADFVNKKKMKPGRCYTLASRNSTGTDVACPCIFSKHTHTNLVNRHRVSREHAARVSLRLGVFFLKIEVFALSRRQNSSMKQNNVG